MGQFYYRPIPSGLADVGRSIAAGITGGVGSYYAGKEATRTRGIEDEERSRRREREDLDLDVMLASAGGGRGARPTELYQPGVGPEPVAVSPHGITMPDVAAFERRDKPGYTQMGDFYMEDPGSRATRLEEEGYERTLGREAAGFELEQGREATERARRGGAIAGALVGGMDPDSPDYAARIGALGAEGYDPLRAMEAAGPQRPVEGTPEWDDWYRRKREIELETRAPTKWETDEDAPPEDEPTPTIGSIEFARTFDFVRSVTDEYDPEGRYTGNPLTESELNFYTQELLAGRDPFESGMNRGEGRLLQRSIDAQSFPGIAAPAAALVGGRAGITDEDVLSIMQANPEASDEEIVELVRQRR